MAKENKALKIDSSALTSGSRHAVGNQAMKPPQGPGPWFGEVLMIVDPERRRELARERARRLRERRREGAVVVTLDASRDLIDFPVENGRLAGWDLDEPKAIAAAIEDLLADMVAGAEPA